MKDTLKYLTLIFLITIGLSAKAQDVPVYNPYYSASFISNPAMAGYNYMSVAVLHRGTLSGVEGSSELNQITFTSPLLAGSGGASMQVISDNVNVFKTLYVNPSLAYRVMFNQYSDLSVGLGAEIVNAKLDMSKVAVQDESDAIINKYGSEATWNYDFTFGMHYKHKYFKLGVIAHRLKGIINSDRSDKLLSEQVSAYFMPSIPLNEYRDLLEFMALYRSLPGFDDYRLDAGAYYTYHNIATFGASYGLNGEINVLAGVQYKGLYIRYNHGMGVEETLRNTGNVSEIMIGYNIFGGNQSQFASAYDQTHDAREIRRRNVYTSNNVGSSSPEKFNRKWKSKRQNSANPSKRYNKSGNKRRKKKRKH